MSHRHSRAKRQPEPNPASCCVGPALCRSGSLAFSSSPLSRCGWERMAASRVLPLRGAEGHTKWTIVELQGSLDGKASSLDGVHLGDLTERRVSTSVAWSPAAVLCEGATLLSPFFRRLLVMDTDRCSSHAFRASCGCGSERARCRGCGSSSRSRSQS